MTYMNIYETDWTINREYFSEKLDAIDRAKQKTGEGYFVQTFEMKLIFKARDYESEVIND